MARTRTETGRCTVIPLYGFLEGDTLGLLILATADTTIAQLARMLRSAARLRADAGEQVCVVFQGQLLDPALTIDEAGITALQRFDVRRIEN